VATPVIIEVKANTSQAKREFASLGSSMKSFGASIRSVVAMSSQAVTGIRQMAQGVQNLGFTMSAMIGLPVAGALKKVAEEATSFEKKLVEVEKTTGMAKDQVAILGEELRKMAMTTPTTAKDLADLAGEAGRAGVGLGNMLAGNVAAAREEILQFVRVMDMMQVSTTLNANEAATAFSRFITLFDEIDTTTIENLGSAINELGQSSSVSEDEVVGAMLRIAPAASTLGLSAADVAGLATSITQMSESMSRGGTRVRVALEQMTINYKKAAELLGISTEEMANKLNEEALPTFMEMVYAIGQIEDATMATQVAMDIFGTTGANAVKRFAAAYPELQQMMAISNQAFEDGTSLQVEFERALTATATQFDILKNAVLEVGYVFAEDLLPVAQEIISALIPAVQELTDWVRKLTVEQKMMAVGAAAFLVVGLPLLALLGSIGFGLSMIVNGAVNLIGGLVGLIATFATFGGGLSLISTLLGGLAAILGGGLVIALLKSGDGFDVITDKLHEIAEGAFDWGDNLIANIAEGIVSAAASTLVRALEFVGGIISMFLEGHSPPEAGPLSSINEWGSRLIDTYLQGFLNADFGILKKVSQIIASVLENMAAIGQMDEVNIGAALADARTLVSELIDVFNKTGVIAEDILGKIEDMLGEAGDEIVQLLRLQLQYNQALKELEKIKQKKSDIEESYQAEARAIAARTDLTEAEKLAAIRAAKKRRDLALSNAETEEQVAQENVDSLKTQVEWQQEYIGALQDQDDALLNYLEALKKLKKTIEGVGSSIKSLADKIADLIADLLRQLEVNKRLQELYESRGMDTTPLLREELSLRKRLVKALMEKKLMYEDLNKTKPEDEWLKLSEAEEQMLSDNIDRIRELEDSLNMSVPDTLIPPVDTSDYASGAEDIAGFVGKIADLGGTVTNTLEKGKALWEAFVQGFSGEDLIPTEIDMSLFGDISEGLLGAIPQEELAAMAGALDESATKFYGWGKKIKDVWDTVSQTFENIKTGIESFKDRIKSIFGGVGDAIGESGITDGTTEMGSAFQKYAPILGTFAASLFLLRNPLLKLAGWLVAPSVIGKFGDAFRGLTKVGGPLSSLATWSTTVWPKAGKKAGSAMQTLALRAMYFKDGMKKIPSALGTIGGAIKSKLSFWKLGLSWVKDFPGEAAKMFGGKVLGSIKGFFSIFSGGLSTIGPAIAGIGSTIAGAAGSIATFVAAASGIIAVVLAVVGVIVAAGVYIKRNWDKFRDAFVQIWDNITGAVKGFMENIKSALGIGEGSGKKFGDVLEDIYKKIEPVAKFIAGAFTKALQIVAGLIKIILPALGKVFGGVIKGIIELVKAIFDILSGIVLFFEGLWKLITGDTEAGKEKLKEAWGKIKDAVMGVLKGLLKAIGGVFLGIFDTVMGIVRSLVDGLVNLFGLQGVVKKISDFVNKIIGFFKNLWNKLIGNSIIPDIVNGIKEWFKKLLKPFQPVIDMFKKFLAYIKKAAEFVSVAFKTGGAEKGFSVLAKVLGPFKQILGPVVDMFYRLYKFLNPIIAALQKGFKEGGIKGAFEALKKILPDVLKNFKKLLGSMMTMVPKVLIGIGKKLWPWITGTLIPWVKDVVGKVWEYLQANVPIWWEAIKTWLSETAAKLWSWITTVLIPWVSNLITQVWTFLQTNLPIWWEAFRTWLSTTAQKLWMWITTVLLPWVIEIIAKVVSFLQTNLPIWWEAFRNWLVTTAQKLWAWITETLIPWVVEIVGKVWAYLKENLPIWFKAFWETVGTIAAALWEWISTKLIPWVVETVQKVVAYLKENLPGWWAKFREVLGTIITGLWNWITTKLIPWIVSTVKKVATYLKENLPKWWAKFKEAIGEIITKLWSWITTTLVPWLKGLIDKGVEWLGKIATDWWNKIKEGLDKIADYFKEIFDTIKETVETAIKAAINGMIDFLEKGINTIINGINNLIGAVNKVLKGLGLGEIGLLSEVRIPRLAKGGIAIKEQLAIVGDVPEAIIPLDRLPDLFGAGGGNSPPNVNITVSGNTVRSDDDIDRIVREVSRKLGQELGFKARNLGRSMA